MNPAPAALVTLLCVAWSVPNYFASLPSWYNLFFAVFAGLALMKHIDDGKVRWLFLAGILAGSSVLVKIVGLYLVAAGLLFLVYRENARWAETPSLREKRTSSFLIVKILGGTAFLAALGYLFRRRDSPMDLFHFVLPGAVLVGVLIGSEWKWGGGRIEERGVRLFRLAGPFLLGAALPIALFTAWYATAGSLGDLVRGVFVLPKRQIAAASFELPPLSALWPAVPYALLLLSPRIFPPLGRRSVLAVSFVLGAVLLLAFSPGVYKTIWLSARSWAPIATLVGCVTIWRAGGEGRPFDRRRQQLFLLLCLTALVSLVQFPFSAPIYFCYVAPLAVLSITAIVAADDRAPRPVHATVLVFYLLFAVIFLNTGYISSLGHRYQRYVADGRLGMERGGLRVPAEDAEQYGALVAAIEQRNPGPEIYAGPDCPEVYFLSGRRNPTRSFFEFQGELGENPEALLPILEARGVRLVVLNRSPDFTDRFDLAFTVALKERFPKRAFIGEFLLMWRE